MLRKRGSKFAVVGLTLLLAGGVALTQFLPVRADYLKQGNLVGYWPLNETSGTSAADISGYGHNGTYSGSPAPSTDVPTTSFPNSRSLSFNGTSDSITTASPFSAGQTDFTISLWVNPAAINTGDYQGIIGRQVGGNTNQRAPSLWVAPSDGGLHYNVFDTTTTNPSYGIINNVFTSANQWVQITWVKNGTTSTFYKNGTAIGTASVPSTFYEGDGDYNFGLVDKVFKGKLDDIRIYNRALSAAEVSQLGSGNDTAATWTGAANNTFSNPSNWDINAVPDGFTDITVPQATNSPTLDMNVQLHNLHVGSSGTFNLAGRNLTFIDAGSFSNDGIMTLLGSETLTGFTNDVDSGSIFYKGNGSYTGLAAGNSYYGLSFSSGVGTWAFNAPLQVYGIFSQWAGTVNTNGYAISAALGWQQYGGTINAGASNITVSSGWTHSSGTFNAGTSTVNFAGNAVTIQNSTSFYNLTYAPPSGGTLLFSAGTTQTITNTLTLAGTSGHLVALKSSMPGTQWQINPSGSSNLTYLNVSDSNNTSGSLLVPSNSVSGGNNTNWDLAAPTVTIPGTDAFSGGYWDDDSTPTLTFSTADSDSSQVKYRVQISKNSDFSSPSVDQTSSLGTPGATSFTPGAALSDGSYYWRVMAIDDGGLESGWTVSNGGAIAFKVDTTAPSVPSANPAGGYYNSEQSVTLASSDSGSGVGDIYYTTNGDAPSKTGSTSTKYTTTVSIDGNKTLKAIAYDKVGNASGVMSEAYQIDTTQLTGGSAVSNELGTTSTITSLQVTSDETNPTVTVKLFVSKGVISLGTVTGLTFYDNNGTSLGATQPSNAASLQFGGTMNDANAALATLTYSRTDGNIGSDSLSASLIPSGSAYYPANGHLYQYVSTPSSWADAKSAAAASSKYGAGGYLATITSRGENDFILSQLKSDSWIGASDDSSVGTTEGNWIWATGPETGQQFWQGTGTSLPTSGHIVGGMYNNWNNSANGAPMQEPNNSNANGENCAEFYYRPTYDGYHPNGTWNDYQCGALLGYIIEYGGLNGINPIVSSKSVAITTSDTVAPNNPALSPAGGIYGGSQSVTISSTDNSGGSGIDNMYYTTDGSAPTSSSIKYTGAITVSSSKTIKAIAYDKAGNTSSVTSATFTIDTAPPSTPGTPTVSNDDGSGGITLGWAASTDSSSGLANPAYTVQWSQSSTFASGISSDTAPSNSYTTSSPLADGIWYFRVRAADAVGNVSAWSSVKSYYINTTILTGGSAVTNEQGKASTINDLQVTSRQSNPTVYVKLFVSSGKISLGATTGLTFYNVDGSSRGSSQPANSTMLHFGGTLNNVNSALASLSYTRTASGTGSDTLSASLINPGEAFFSGNGHLYQYVAGPVSWSSALSSAAGMSKYGTQGYLATITSQAENDFIATQLKSDSWIGGSDSYMSDQWRWVAGPEGQQDSGRGFIFWNSGYTYGYSNWNTGEPNNSGGNENCAQFYYSNNGKWNDLNCSNSLGYIVEYGGLNNLDPTIASKAVAITTVTDSTPPTQPGKPSVSPASPTANNKPSLNWAASTDSGSGLASPAYTVQWSQDSAFSAVAGSATANSPNYTLASSLPDGTWYFRVVATDKSGNSATSDISDPLLVDTTSPLAPASSTMVVKDYVIGTPVCASSSCGNDNAPTLQFDMSSRYSVGQKVKYRLQIASDSGFSSLLIDYTSGLIDQAPSQFVVGQPANDGNYSAGADLNSLADGKYFWRAKTIGANGLESSFGVPSEDSFLLDTAKPDAPVFSLAGGSYSGSQLLALSAHDNLGGSGIEAIYFTLDGSEPTNSSTKFTEKIHLTNSKTIKAIAYDNAGNPSNITMASYTITPPTTANSSAGKTNQPAGEGQTSSVSSQNQKQIAKDQARANDENKDASNPQLPVVKFQNGSHSPDQTDRSAYGKNTSFLLGLGWWWLLVLTFIIICWRLLASGKRRSKDNGSSVNR